MNLLGMTTHECDLPGMVIGNECMKLEKDLSAFHQTRSSKAYRTMLSGQRPINVFMLLQRVLLSGGFQRVCDEKRWSQVRSEAGVLKCSVRYCKRWYVPNVLPYEEALVVKVRNELSNGTESV